MSGEGYSLAKEQPKFGILEPCIHSRPRVDLDYQKWSQSGLCSKPPDLRSVSDLILNPSLRKSKRE